MDSSAVAAVTDVMYASSDYSLDCLVSWALEDEVWFSSSEAEEAESVFEVLAAVSSGSSDSG